MLEKLDMKSMDIAQENIKKIRELFPDSVTEINENGKTKLAIDFDALKANLSNDIIVDTDKRERYVMTWPDKQKAKRLVDESTTKTLRPCKEESVDFDNTKNLYIEGDNLEVLKVLRETYLGKVKMIYIDPPYNTGNDFVYNDNFDIDNQDYKEMNGEYDDEGNRLVKNPETNGRFHTDWLNMIYPRLKVARDLLSDDGVIFISIDDNEQANLKKVCDEIFGEDNFIVKFIWEKTQHFGRQKLNSYSNADYIFCYAKKLFSNNLKELLVETINDDLQDAPLFNASNNINTLTFPKGTVKFNIDDGIYNETKSDEYILINPVVVENSRNKNDFSLKFRSRWSNKTVQEEIKKGTTFWVKTEAFAIRTIYNTDKSTTVAPKQIIFTNLKNEFCAKNRNGLKVSTSENATNDLIKLMDGQYFSYPKPVSLITYLINLMYNEKESKFYKNFTILDFFSGSATTAHAVMQLNAEDGGNRQFIMVQLPEKCDENSEAFKAGYKNICEIGKERIRRAAKKIKEENPDADFDGGFRVLKLDSSNMQDVYYNPSAMTQSLLDYTIDNIKPDRKPIDLLFQVLLDLGQQLSADIEEREINGKKIFIVNENDLVACFDDNIDDEVITTIAKMQPIYAVFRDKSFVSDSVSINNEQIFRNYSPSTKIKVV